MLKHKETIEALVAVFLSQHERNTDSLSFEVIKFDNSYKVNFTAKDYTNHFAILNSELKPPFRKLEGYVSDMVDEYYVQVR